MKSAKLSLILVPATTVALLAGEADLYPGSSVVDLGAPSPKGILEPVRMQRSRWSFGGGIAPLFGVDARFSGLGGFTNPLMSLPTGGGQNYFYDDGYVGVDSSGNTGGQTWNFGYTSHIDPSATELELSISNSASNAVASSSDEADFGFEFFARYDLGEVPRLSLGSQAARWGLKSTLHYANLSISNNSQLTADVVRLTDRFGLNGVLLPMAPYAGSFNGPGPLIRDSPIRTTSIVAGGATVMGSRDLNAHLFSFSVGPYLEFPITERFSLSAELALSLGIMDGEYSFSSATSIPGVGTQNQSASGDETSLITGFSFGLNGIYQINDDWSAYGGVRYQYYEDFEINAGNSKAELDFGGAYMITLGALWQF